MMSLSSTSPGGGGRGGGAADGRTTAGADEVSCVDFSGIAEDG